MSAPGAFLDGLFPVIPLQFWLHLSSLHSARLPSDACCYRSQLASVPSSQSAPKQKKEHMAGEPKRMLWNRIDKPARAPFQLSAREICSKDEESTTLLTVGKIQSSLISQHLLWEFHFTPPPPPPHSWKCFCWRNTSGPKWARSESITPLIWNLISQQRGLLYMLSRFLIDFDPVLSVWSLLSSYGNSTLC